MAILLGSSSQPLSYSKLLHKESEKQSQTSRPIKEDAGGQKNQRVKRRVRVPAFRHPYKQEPYPYPVPSLVPAKNESTGYE